MVARTRLVCFSPARASGRIKRTVIRKAKTAGILAASLALGPIRRVRLPASTLTVIIIPMCNKRITPLTVRHLRGVHNASAPMTLMMICKGHTCRGTLARLSTFILLGNFGMVTKTAFVKRRSCDDAGCPVTTNHPSARSLRLTERFNGGLEVGIRTTSYLRALCPIGLHSVPHPRRPFFPLFHFLHEMVGLHGDKMPLPHAP